jgi:hypothetical protein
MQPQDSSTQPLLGSEIRGQNSITYSPQSSPKATPTKTMETRKMAKKVFLESKAKTELRNLPKEAPKDAQSPVLPFETRSQRNQSKKDA